jgi:hypothetical protein
MSGQQSTILFCTECGSAVDATAKFCTSCGARQEAVAPEEPETPGAPVIGAHAADGADVPAYAAASALPPPSSPAPPAAVAADGIDWQRSLPVPFNALPLQLLLVCTLMAAAGVLTWWPTLTTLDDIFRLLGMGGIWFQFGLLLLLVWVVLAAFGTGCMYLAWRMAHADRVARGLAYVLLLGLGCSILVGKDKSTVLVLVMLACFGAFGVLIASPAVRDFFAGPDAPDAEQPTPIVIARTLLAIWTACVLLVGLAFLPLGGLGGKFVVIGIILLAVGAAAWHLNGRLAARDQTARVVVSAGAAVYAVLLLIAGEREAGLILPLALAAGVAWNLWAPPAAQDFFSPSTTTTNL